MRVASVPGIDTPGWITSALPEPSPFHPRSVVPCNKPRGATYPWAKEKGGQEACKPQGRFMTNYRLRAPRRRPGSAVPGTSWAVYRAAYRITGNAMDAEDVLQTVSPVYCGERSSRTFPRARELSAPRGRECRARSDAAPQAGPAGQPRGSRRRARRHRRAGTGTGAGEPGARRVRLREAMSRRSPRQAEIFCLRYLEGIGNLEIARMLGASATSIAVLLHRARAPTSEGARVAEGEMP